LRLLLDSCLSGALKAPLTDAGHEVLWAGDWPSDPGDEEILRRAHAEQCVLITLDKDFGELAIVRGIPHSGLIRLAGISLASQAATIKRVLVFYGDRLSDGAVVTVEPARVRVRSTRGGGDD
jgi:predicted nuclease of predicted toxin-antitoxin system